jgi:hypothetical protein
MNYLHPTCFEDIGAAHRTRLEVALAQHEDEVRNVLVDGVVLDRASDGRKVGKLLAADIDNKIWEVLKDVRDVVDDATEVTLNNGLMFAERHQQNWIEEGLALRRPVDFTAYRSELVAAIPDQDERRAIRACVDHAVLAAAGGDDVDPEEKARLLACGSSLTAISAMRAGTQAAVYVRATNLLEVGVADEVVNTVMQLTGADENEARRELLLGAAIESVRAVEYSPSAGALMISGLTALFESR